MSWLNKKNKKTSRSFFTVHFYNFVAAKKYLECFVVQQSVEINSAPIPQHQEQCCSDAAPKACIFLWRFLKDNRLCRRSSPASFSLSNPPFFDLRSTAAQQHRIRQYSCSLRHRQYVNRFGNTTRPALRFHKTTRTYDIQRTPNIEPFVPGCLWMYSSSTGYRVAWLL